MFGFFYMIYVRYICENIILLSKGIASSTKMHWQSSIEKFSCNTQSTKCMHSTFVNCSNLELNMDDFHNNEETITFHQWVRFDNKIQKSEIELPCDEICQKFNNDIKVLKKHIYVKRQEHACYNKLKEELGENEVLLHVDYCGNYSNIQ